MRLSVELVIALLSVAHAEFTASKEPSFHITLTNESFVVGWVGLVNTFQFYHIQLNAVGLPYQKIKLEAAEGFKVVPLYNPCWEWQVEVYETTEKGRRFVTSLDNSENLGYVRDVEFWPLEDSIVLTWWNVSMCIPDRLMVNVITEGGDHFEYNISSSVDSVVVHPDNLQRAHDYCFESVFHNDPTQNYMLCKKGIQASPSEEVSSFMQLKVIDDTLEIRWPEPTDYFDFLYLLVLDDLGLWALEEVSDNQTHAVFTGINECLHFTSALYGTYSNGTKQLIQLGYSSPKSYWSENLKAYWMESELLLFWKNSDCYRLNIVLILKDYHGYIRDTIHLDSLSIGYLASEKLSQNVEGACISPMLQNSLHLGESCTRDIETVRSLGNEGQINVTNNEDSFTLQWDHAPFPSDKFLMVIRESQLIQLERVSESPITVEVDLDNRCAFYQFLLVSRTWAQLLAKGNNSPDTLQIVDIESYRIGRDVLVIWKTQGPCVAKMFNVTLRGTEGQDDWYYTELYRPGVVFSATPLNFTFYVEVSTLDEWSNLRIRQAEPVVYKEDIWNLTLAALLETNSMNISWNRPATTQSLRYKLIWFKDNKYHGIYTVDPRQSYFTINNIDLCQSHEFSLQGISPLGVQFNLGQIAYAGALPGIPTLGKLEIPRILLHWTSPHRCTPTQIRIYAEENERPLWIHTAEENSSSVEKEQLQFCATYTFRLIFQHTDGSEQVSDPLSLKTLPENTIRATPTVHLENDGSFLVSWSSRSGCQVKSTKVVLNELGVGILEYTVEGEKETTQILNIKPCSFYRVQLRTEYASGYIEESAVVEVNSFTTRLSPVNVSTYVSGEKVRIEWDPANTCNILSYRLDVVDTSTGQVRFYVTAETKFNVPISSEIELYHVMLSSLSPVGQTQIAPMEAIWPGRVPAKPETPTVTPEGNYIKVHWNRSLVDRNIHSYKLTVIRPGHSVKHWTVPSDESFKILEDISTSELPSFSLRALNQYGESQPSESVELRNAIF